MDIRTFFLPPHTRLALLITLIQITLSIGTTFERTIDDTFGDSESGLLPIYTPAKNFSPVCFPFILWSALCLQNGAPEFQLH
jgi:hypothetical protein